MYLLDRKLQDLFQDKSIQEKCMIVFISFLGFVGFILTFVKIRGGIGGMNRICTSNECLVSAESIKRSINVDVEPCDNFYEFACGKWHLSHNREFKKPNNWFIERSQITNAKITRLLEKPDSDSDLKSMKQARRLYRTCMDTDTLRKLEYEPVFQFLEKVGLPRRIPNFASPSHAFHVERTLALIERYLGVDLMFQLSLALNPKTNRTIIEIGPMTTIVPGLPEPLFDYHFNQRQLPRESSDSEQEEETNRLIYTKINYMINVITSLFPMDIFDSQSIQNTCFKIIVMEVLLRRPLDLDEEAQEFTTKDLSNHMHSNSSGQYSEKLFDWQLFIDYFTIETNLTWTMDDLVLVRDQNFFLYLQSKLINTPLLEIEQFLWWKVVETLIPHTTNEMAKLRSELNARSIPLWQKYKRSQFCTTVVRYFMKGPIAYEFYVRDNLKDTKDKVQIMIKQLQVAFSDMIRESNWTDDATKQVTTEKANAIKVGVGYPIIFDSPEELDKNYDYINVQDNQYLQTMLNIKAYEFNYLVGKVGEKVTIDESDTKTIVTDPLEVNAYYNRIKNSINIPSGILQLPFFYKGVDVVNYGAIGTILGHEISHGFDIEGKDYDIHGKKNSQWSQNSVREYLNRAQCFIEQYNKFTLDSYNKLNGTLTLAENMADNVGLKQSWKAYKSNYVGEEFSLAGLTEYSNDQLFFLSFANVWCQNSENAKIEQIDIFGTNDHSPSYARVLGSLRNSPEFAETWKCPVGSPMNPSKKCSMW